MSIEPPNYTQIPNVILDEFMAEIKEAELRVVLAVCRQTFGWHKERDQLSLSQLMEMTGLSRQGVLNGIEDAMAHDLLGRIPAGNSFEYFVIVNEVDQSTKLTSNGKPSRPESVNVVDTQKKETKEINNSVTDLTASALKAQGIIEHHAALSIGAALAEQYGLMIEEFGADLFEVVIARIAKRGDIRKIKPPYVRTCLTEEKPAHVMSFAEKRALGLLQD